MRSKRADLTSTSPLVCLPQSTAYYPQTYTLHSIPSCVPSECWPRGQRPWQPSLFSGIYVCCWQALITLLVAFGEGHPCLCWVWETRAARIAIVAAPRALRWGNGTARQGLADAEQRARLLWKSRHRVAKAGLARGLGLARGGGFACPDWSSSALMGPNHLSRHLHCYMLVSHT